MSSGRFSMSRSQKEVRRGRSHQGKVGGKVWGKAGSCEGRGQRGLSCPHPSPASWVSLSVMLPVAPFLLICDLFTPSLNNVGFHTSISIIFPFWVKDTLFLEYCLLDFVPKYFTPSHEICYSVYFLRTVMFI